MVIVGAVSDPGNIAPPSGWSEIKQAVIASSTNRVGVFYKIASSEVVAYTFNWTNVSGTGFWIFAEYGGGNLTYPLDGSGMQQNALGVGSIAPSLSPEVCNNYNTQLQHPSLCLGCDFESLECHGNDRALTNDSKG